MVQGNRELFVREFSEPNMFYILFRLEIATLGPEIRWATLR